MFLRLFYVVSNKIKHNTLIYNKLKLLLFNLKSTSYKNLNIEYHLACITWSHDALVNRKRFKSFFGEVVRDSARMALTKALHRL